MAYRQILHSADDDQNTAARKFEIDQKVSRDLFEAIKRGSISRLKRCLEQLEIQKHLIFRYSMGDEVVETATIPHAAIPKAVDLPFTQLCVRNPTLLAIAVLNDLPKVVEELGDLVASTLLADGDINGLLDIGNDVYEVNVRGELEWRATSVTPLMIACMLDKAKCVESLLIAGANAKASSSLGRTPLHEACFQGNSATALLCINHGSNVNAVDHDGVSPLMLSAARGANDLLRLLLSKGADTRQQDSSGRSALFYCLQSGPETARSLIKADRNCYMRDSDGFGAFLSSCRMGLMEMITFFIEEAGILGLKYNSVKTASIVNEEDLIGRNGLHLAAELGSEKLYLKLVESGISHQCDNEGRTPLMIACLTGKIEFVEFLINVNPNGLVDRKQKDTKGRNAIFYAITAGSIPLIEYLSEHGVAFETTPNGLTPLLQAAGKGKVEVIKFLMENREHFNIDINACDSDGWNAAMYAASTEDLEVLEELVVSGIEFRVTNDGRTVLMESAYHGNVKMVNYVIDVMRQRNIENAAIGGFRHCDNEGWNAVMYSLMAPDSKASIKLLQIFKDHAGIKPMTTTKGVTALMEVALKGSLVLTNFLLENSAEYDIDLFAIDDDGANALSYAALGGSVAIFNAFFSRGLRCILDKQLRSVLMLAANRGNFELTNYLLKNATKYEIDCHVLDGTGRNAIFYGCQSGSITLVKTLLDHGIQVLRDNDGVSVLMAAAELGNCELFEWLMENLPTAVEISNEIDKKGRNILFYGLRSGNSKLIEKLIFDANLTSRAIEIPLESSSIVCHLVRRFMLDSEADETRLSAFLNKFTSPALALNASDETGQSIFYALAAENKLETLEKYASYYDPTLARSCHRHGVTLLMQSCASSMVDVVKLLLKTSSNIRALLDAEDNQGRSALTYAVVSHNVIIVRLLIEKGARMTLDSNGHCALTYSIQSRSLQISLMLLKSVFQINNEIGKTRDREGNLLLHYCSKHGGNEELAELIIHRTGADLNARTARGNHTSLMVAVVNGNVAIARALLKLGCSVTATDSHGKTVLHLLLEAAFKDGKPSSRTRRKVPLFALLNLLLKSKASSLINEQDNSGTTALMLACSAGMPEVAFILLEHGASLELKDNAGKTAIDLCDGGDSNFILAFRKMLLLIRQPGKAASTILQRYEEEIREVLTVDGDDVAAERSMFDLLKLNKRNPYSYVTEEVLFQNVCETIEKDVEFKTLGAMLRSELYKAEIRSEIFV